jgi:hypothetical protein
LVDWEAYQFNKLKCTLHVSTLIKQNVQRPTNSAAGNRIDHYKTRMVLKWRTNPICQYRINKKDIDELDDTIFRVQTNNKLDYSNFSDLALELYK